MRELLPERCTKTDYQVNRNYLYMHVRPTQNAGLTLGLYTDSKCSTLYDQGSFKKKFDVFSLVGTTESNFNSFNTLLNGYKTCQPCIAYNLSDSDYTCNDDAGYTNCIQVRYIFRSLVHFFQHDSLFLHYLYFCFFSHCLYSV
jgi:hypothetical protein